MKQSSPQNVCFSSSDRKECLNGEIALISKTIREKKDFILATHIQPDGDAIGSILGLGLFLKKMGKKVFVSWGQSSKSDEQNGKTNLIIPKQYSFLPGLELLSDPSECPKTTECFIALDCASFERLGNLKECSKKATFFINIDHHHDNSRFAHINYIDENSPATAEMVYQIIKQMEGEMDRDIATCLYLGLVTDTGRFQYSNTNKRAFQMVLSLLDYGVIPSEIFHNVYENVTSSYLRLLGRVLKNIKFVSEVAYAKVSQSDLISTGVEIEETENLINFLRSIGEAKVAAIIKETSDGKWKVSLRSKNKIDVSKVAGCFGGGGHRNAAGYSSEKNYGETIKLMLEALKDL